MKIAAAAGRCERCGAVGVEVHHINHLTPDNIGDSLIRINQDNLILLCNQCHSKEYHRFEGSKKCMFESDGKFTGVR